MERISSDALSQYISSRFPGSRISGFQFLVSGFESDVYAFNLHAAPWRQSAFILRLYPGKGADEKLLREAKGLSLLQRAGYPVPGLLVQETDPAILGKPFTIIDKLEGEALWPILAAAEPSQAALLLERFGKLIYQLHQLDWRPFLDHPEQIDLNPDLLLDEVLSFYRRLYTKYDVEGFLSVVDWLERRKGTIPVQPAVVHQDFHANNVFVCSDGQPYVLDWTQIAVSDFRLDLCWTLMIMGDFGKPEWAAHTLQSYAQGLSAPAAHLDYFFVIVYMKLLASTVISLKHSPEELGMRSESIDSLKSALPKYRELTHRLQAMTGVSLTEVWEALKRIPTSA